MAASVVHRSAPHVALRDASLMLAAVAGLAIYVRHAAGYFFLFDDYALLHEASRLPAADILRAALFDFYRPAAFLLTRAEFALAGWSMPALYAGTNLLIHVANTGLVYLLANRLAPREETRSSGPAIAALLYGLSPWALEAPFWVSARFDVLAAFGVLGAVMCGVVFCEAPRPAVRWLAAAGGCAAAAAGMFAKEMAVTAPLLFAVIALTSGTVSGWPWRRALWFAAALAAVAAAYLAAREQVLPGLNGTYGSYADLLSRASVAGNTWRFVARLFRFAENAPAAVRALAAVVLAAASVAAVAGLMMRPRLLTLCATGFLISLLPVAWAGLPDAGSGGGRFLYLPGVWFALMLGLGLGRNTARLNLARTNAVLTAATVLLLASSVWWQSRVWASASGIARASILQLAPYANTTRPIFIPNLPFWYAEGAYVLKGYAFSFYYGESKLPPIRVRPLSLTHAGDVSSFATWADHYGTATPSPGDLVVPLTLPVNGLVLAPLAPENLKAESSGDTVRLTWETRRLADAVPERIVMEAGLSASFTRPVAVFVLAGAATEHVVENVAANTYYVRIRAENGSGVSAISPEMVVKVQ